MSTLAAETLAQVEAAETCYWLSNRLFEVLRGKPIKTDSKKGIECKTSITIHSTKLFIQ